jgi:hypothetical protein
VFDYLSTKPYRLIKKALPISSDEPQRVVAIEQGGAFFFGVDNNDGSKMESFISFLIEIIHITKPRDSNLRLSRYSSNKCIF